MAVVGGIADRDVEVAGVEFDVFVARDPLHGKIAKRHAHIEVRGFRDFDGDAQVATSGAPLNTLRSA